MSIPCELLSEITRFAVREPLCNGVKVTLIVHDAPTARLVPQLLVSAKSLGLTPVKLKLVMFNCTLPLLLNVTA